MFKDIFLNVVWTCIFFLKRIHCAQFGFRVWLLDKLTELDLRIFGSFHLSWIISHSFLHDLVFHSLSKRLDLRLYLNLSCSLSFVFFSLLDKLSYLVSTSIEAELLKKFSCKLKRFWNLDKFAVLKNQACVLINASNSNTVEEYLISILLKLDDIFIWRQSICESVLRVFINNL